MALHQITKWLAMGLLSSALSGCFGGTVAQQLVSSILMHGADKATATSIEAAERRERQTTYNGIYKSKMPDEYKVALLNSRFESVSPQIEAVPINLDEQKNTVTAQESKLVQVEVWNLLIGEEKQQLFEKARLQGSTSLPPKEEWQQWQLAIGGTANNDENQTSNGKQEAITFLIPPEIGKMRSGAKALVELSSAGEMNVARYSTQ